MASEVEDSLTALTSYVVEDARREEVRVQHADTNAAGVITLGLAVAGLVTAMVSDADLDSTEIWLLQGSVGAIVLAILPALVARLGTPLRGRSERARLDAPKGAIDDETPDPRRAIYEVWRLRAEQARLTADGKQFWVNCSLVILSAAAVPLGILAVMLAGSL